MHLIFIPTSHLIFDSVFCLHDPPRAEHARMGILRALMVKKPSSMEKLSVSEREDICARRIQVVGPIDASSALFLE